MTVYVLTTNCQTAGARIHGVFGNSEEARTVANKLLAEQRHLREVSIIGYQTDGSPQRHAVTYSRKEQT
jgi:hypothetical protein